jgi:hypothetical protein
MKNQVGQIGFLGFFKPDFYCLRCLQKSILKLIFADFSNLIFQKSTTDG